MVSPPKINVKDVSLAKRRSILQYEPHPASRGDNYFINMTVNKTKLPHLFRS